MYLLDAVRTDTFLPLLFSLPSIKYLFGFYFSVLDSSEAALCEWKIHHKAEKEKNLFSLLFTALSGRAGL